MTEILAHKDRPLPVGSIGYMSTGWAAAIFLLISEASVFAYLFFTYFYFSVQPNYQWPAGNPPTFLYSAPQTAIVLIGAATSWWADRSAARGAMANVTIALAITIVLGAAFIALQFVDWFTEPFSLASSAYGSNYYVIGGFHLAHFVAGWIMFLVLLMWTWLGYFDAVRHVPITVGALYWYFLAATWIAVFFVLYCTPRFG
jgi:heme/copper-type cytochrome/quinol oxidase subunit 3